MNPAWLLTLVRDACGSLAARLYLHAKGVRFGPRLSLRSLPFVERHSEASIVLGEGVKILNTLRENPAGICHRTVLAAVKPGAVLRIGDQTGMSGAVVYCTEQITIEDYVTLGLGVKVYDSDFHPLDAGARRRHDTAQIASAPVRICRDAYLGAEVTVLKGVTIGERAVIGARSVVTRDIPADTVAAGIPAAVLRKTSRSLECH